MTSRIDGNQGSGLPTQIERTEAGKTTERAQNQAKAAKADRVEVSPDAALMNSAAQAANGGVPRRGITRGWEIFAIRCRSHHGTPVIRCTNGHGPRYVGCSVPA